MNLSWSAYLTVKVVATVLEGLAMLLTVFRLSHRLRIRRFWWEDAWALLGLLCTLAVLASGWVHILTLSTASHVSIVTFWIYTFSFTCVVWSVRMSVLLSITRMIYPNKPLRHLMHGVAALFILLFGGLIIQKAYKCGSSLTWYTSTSLSCHLPRPMASYELASDIVSDTILVSLPLRLLWRIKLPRRERKMFLAVFSSSLVMSVVSMFHATTQLARINSLISTATDFEVALCLIVCNLLVVVAFIYRLVKQGKDDDKSDSNNEHSDSSDRDQSPRALPTTQYLTTVDLEHLTGHMDITAASGVGLHNQLSSVVSLTAVETGSGAPKGGNTIQQQ
ncbi:hypothetical protein BV22DRAFT_574771 [Leucogyrophana mollusca]|uniref:Uncharacterized protein n=1 Tax=Leucogyrophana mollusca TaxID=85980 RepID=A0ACB8BDF5_9AGAM|nr:hypothetical protein BV22DRAFT_574771 [Leucogyrophana mollusca]